MKKLVVMLALGITVAGASYAQNGPQPGKSSGKKTEQERKDAGDDQRRGDKKQDFSPEERATKRTQMLSQKLDLSNSQKKKLQALNLQHAREMENLHGQFAKGGKRDEKQHQQILQSRTKWEKEFKSIVSKKQYAQYETERKQMQGNRGNRIEKGRDNGSKPNRSERG